MCFGSVEQKAETPVPGIRVFRGKTIVTVSFPKEGGGWTQTYVYLDGTTSHYSDGINPNALASFPWYTELTPN